MTKAAIKFSILYRPTGEEIDLPVLWICHEYSSICFQAPVDSKYDGIDRLPGHNNDTEYEYGVYVHVNGEKHLYTGPFLAGCNIIYKQNNEGNKLAHDGLPDDCIKGWGEVKFCENRQGDGNACKHCSHYKVE